MAIIACASPKTSLTSFATLRLEIARLPPYLSPSRVTPNACLKNSLDLAARIFPLISIIDIASISSLVDRMSSDTLSAAPEVIITIWFLYDINHKIIIGYLLHLFTNARQISKILRNEDIVNNQNFLIYSF